MEWGLNNDEQSGSSLLEGVDFLLKGSAALDVRIIPNGSSSISEELLVDTGQTGVSLSAWFLDAVLVVLVVLVFR